MNTLLLTIPALIIGFLIGYWKCNQKVKKYLRLISANEEYIAALQHYSNLLETESERLQKELDESEKERQRLLDSRLIATPEIYKQFQPIKDDISYAHRLYHQLVTDPKFVFKLKDARENGKMVNAIHSNIMIFGVEGTKQLYIGTMLKELLYKLESEFEAELMPVNRMDYLLTTACMMDMLIDKLSLKAQPQDN